MEDVQSPKRLSNSPSHEKMASKELRDLQNQISPGVQTRHQARVSGSPEVGRKKAKRAKTQTRGGAKKAMQRGRSRKPKASSESDSSSSDDDEE